jgi:hypothetical protein
MTSDATPAPRDEVRRTIDLDIAADELWALVATRDGWRSWLVDDAAVTIAPGGRGTTVENGRRREVVIGTVVDEEEIGFTWWDEHDPSGASRVRITIGAGPEGQRRLTVVECPVAAVGLDVIGVSAAVRWDVRAVSLWATSVRGSARV